MQPAGLVPHDPYQPLAGRQSQDQPHQQHCSSGEIHQGEHFNGTPCMGRVVHTPGSLKAVSLEDPDLGLGQDQVWQTQAA